MNCECVNHPSNNQPINFLSRATKSFPREGKKNNLAYKRLPYSTLKIDYYIIGTHFYINFFYNIISWPLTHRYKNNQIETIIV